MPTVKVELTNEILAELKQVAKLYGVPVQEVVWMAISRYLAEEARRLSSS